MTDIEDLQEEINELQDYIDGLSARHRKKEANMYRAALTELESRLEELKEENGGEK